MRALVILLVVLAVVLAALSVIRSVRSLPPNAAAGGAAESASPAPTAPRSTHIATPSSTSRSTPRPTSASTSAKPASSAATPAASATAAVPPTSASAAALLATAVEGQHLPGRLSVTVLDTNTGVNASYGPKRRFATASIVKLDILIALLMQRDGKLTGSQRALAVRMMEHSDNDAATALWNQIGGGSGLARANAESG